MTGKLNTSIYFCGLIGGRFRSTSNVFMTSTHSHASSSNVPFQSQMMCEKVGEDKGLIHGEFFAFEFFGNVGFVIGVVVVGF